MAEQFVALGAYPLPTSGASASERSLGAKDVLPVLELGLAVGPSAESRKCQESGRNQIAQ
jgi:hypothetical protein